MEEAECIRHVCELRGISRVSDKVTVQWMDVSLLPVALGDKLRSN